MNSFLQYFSQPSQGKDLNAINVMSSKILGIILAFGYSAAVIMTVYIGMRYMMAKPAERSQLKSSLAYIMVGAILLVGGSTLLGILGGLFGDFGDSVKGML